MQHRYLGSEQCRHKEPDGRPEGGAGGHHQVQPQQHLLHQLLQVFVVLYSSLVNLKRSSWEYWSLCLRLKEVIMWMTGEGGRCLIKGALEVEREEGVEGGGPGAQAGFLVRWG